MRNLLAAALLILLSACGGDDESRALQYYFTYDPRSLDPALSTDVPTGEVVALLFDTVTRFDVDGRLVPGLATRWETDSTGTVYTFHIRTGARFHDRRPLTAHEVRTSFLRALDPKNTGARAWPLTPIRGAAAFTAGTSSQVDGLTAPDDTTLVITLDQPLNIFPKFLAMPATAIVPPDPPADFDQRPVGSGPWRFVSWSHDDEIRLAKNPDYWGGAPKSDSLRIRIIPEPLTQAAEYEAQQLTVVEIPFGETRRWELAHPDELQRRPAIRDLYIAMNTTRGPLRDVRVRRAINLAVDVPTLLHTVMADRGVRAAGVIPPGIVGYDSTRAPYHYDPAAARRLLAEAGHAGGFALQLWRSQRPEYARIAQSVQQYLGAVGIRVEIVERDASSARAAVRKGQADLFLSDWYADYPDAENFTYPLFDSKNRGAGGNYAFLADTALDGMIERMRTTPDSGRQAALARDVDGRIFDLAPWIFLWFPVDLWALQPDVTGWRIPAIFFGQRWMDTHRTDVAVTK